MTTPVKQETIEDKADRIALRIDRRFVLFPTPEKCADAAAPVFKANRWRWTERGIPDWADIVRTLLSLQTAAESDKQDYCESGRLIFYRGQYGHERAPSGKGSR